MYVSHAHLFVKRVHAPLLPCVLNIIRARRVLAHLPFLAEMPVSPFCERTLDRAPGPCRGAVLPSTAYSPTACLSRQLQAPRGQPPCRRCSTASQTVKEALTRCRLNSALAPHCPLRTRLTTRAGRAHCHLAVPSYHSSNGAGNLRSPLAFQLPLGKQKRTRKMAST